jgi:hypothetical protein
MVGVAGVPLMAAGIAAGVLAPVALLAAPVIVFGTAGALPPATTPDGTELATPGVPQAATVKRAKPPATTNGLSNVILTSVPLEPLTV